MTTDKSPHRRTTTTTSAEYQVRRATAVGDGQKAARPVSGPSTLTTRDLAEREQELERRVHAARSS
jgi:hypothetical protein